MITCLRKKFYFKNCVVYNRLPDLYMLIMLGNEKYRGAFSFDDILKAPSTSEISAISDLQGKLQFDDPINIQFTSVGKI